MRYATEQTIVPVALLAALVGQVEAMAAGEASVIWKTVQLPPPEAATSPVHRTGTGEPPAHPAKIGLRGLQMDGFLDPVLESPPILDGVGRLSISVRCLSTPSEQCTSDDLFLVAGLIGRKDPELSPGFRRSTIRATSEMTIAQHSSTVRFFSW